MNKEVKQFVQRNKSNGYTVLEEIKKIVFKNNGNQLIPRRFTPLYALSKENSYYIQVMGESIIKGVKQIRYCSVYGEIKNKKLYLKS